jgi:hypothetical protein
MKRFFWCGAALAFAAAFAVYLGTEYTRRHPNSLVGWCAALASSAGVESSLVYHLRRAMNSQQTDGPHATTAEEEEECVVPDDPEPACESRDETRLPAALPELPETIDLLRPQPEPADKKDGPKANDAADIDLPSGSLGTLVPTRWDVEQDPYRVMPSCEDEEKTFPPAMPYAAKRGTQPPVPAPQPSMRKEGPKKGSVDARVKELLRPFQPSEDKRPARSDIDTLEFRPSDAKNGEFERIPF